MQEEACARSEAAKGVSESKENRKQCHKEASSRHKVRMIECVWPTKFQNVEVDNDVMEVVSVSADSEVVSVRPSPDSPAPDLPLTDTEFLVRSHLFLKLRKAFATNVANEAHGKQGKTC